MEALERAVEPAREAPREEDGAAAFVYEYDHEDDGDYDGGEEGCGETGELREREAPPDEEFGFIEALRSDMFGNLDFVLLPEDLLILDGEIVSLDQLRALDVAHNRIDSISALASLHDLEVLDLAYNDVEDISDLLGLRGLRFLNLVGNPILDRSAIPCRGARAPWRSSDATRRTVGGGVVHCWYPGSTATRFPGNAARCMIDVEATCWQPGKRTQPVPVNYPMTRARAERPRPKRFWVRAFRLSVWEPPRGYRRL